MPKLTYLFVFLYISPLLQAQSQTAYQAPLDLPLYLSGNFGELRSDHFHSGIDIKTQGRTGHPVRTISDGQVSRIKVQASGYGKSIYIAHPDGKTSVYGHLDSYRDDIAAYVRDMQYKQQSQEVDLYPEAGRFPIMQGEQIALSGNSGSSGGPHLHFEIRQTANQNPTNVLSYGFPIADHLAPRFRSLHVIPCSGDGDTEVETGMRSFSLVSEGNNFSPGQGRQIPASGCVTLGVEVFDYLDGSSNRCGIHTLDLYVDDELSFHYAMDEFSFAETRYINAHLLYPEKIQSGKLVHRLHRLPGDRLSLYGKMIDQGKIRVPVGETRRIRVVARDVAGNQSQVNFELYGTTPAQASDVTTRPTTGEGPIFVEYRKSFAYDREGLAIRMDPLTLYENIRFEAEKQATPPGCVGTAYRVHHPGTPVHKAYSLSIEAPELDPSLAAKYLLVEVGKDGSLHAVGGTCSQGVLRASPRGFGTFAIALDTLPPRIRAINGSDGADQKDRDRLSFHIEDALSGIGSFRGFIDNQWALFEYDPKNARLDYFFDKDRIVQGTRHELELYVTDDRGNVSLYHQTFFW